MIAADTSSLINFLSGADTSDAELVEKALRSRLLRLPPPVVTELLSHRTGQPALSVLLGETGLLDVTDGYWTRAGRLRAAVLARGRRARLADCLIAQACIDADVALIARDKDYRHFSGRGLRLAT